MADESSNREKILRIRVSAAEKAAYDAGATQLQLTTSEFARQAMDEKLERDLALRVGVRPVAARPASAHDPEDDALAPLEAGKEEFSLGR